MKQVGVFLHQFHWFQFFNHRFFADFIFRFPAFFLKMPGIGYISHIPHLVAKMLQVAVYNIKRNVRSCMTEMTFATHGRSAHIHAYITICNGPKFFFTTG